MRGVRWFGLFFILVLGFSSCSAEVSPKNDYFLARVTFYTDCPKWGKKTASQVIAEQGTTVAAAKHEPFGTRYFIPRLREWMDTDGKFIVLDRGPHVCSRKASRGKFPVIDVYVSSKSLVRKFGQRKENIFRVYRK